MKCAYITQWGNQTPLEVGEREKPVILKTTDVLIKVVAASLNPIDYKMKSGWLSYLVPQQLPLIPGFDISGIIEEIGPNVVKFKVGDRVFTRLKNPGALAQYVLENESNLVQKPENISFEEAAALPLASLTSYQALKRLDLQPGDDLYITRGSGGTGVSAIQIAKKVYGAHVITSSNESKIPLLKSLGADRVLDYHRQKFSDVLHDMGNVYDNGGDFWSSISITRRQGKCVTIAGIPRPQDLDLFKDSMKWWVPWALSVVSAPVRLYAKYRGVDYSFLWMKPSTNDLQKIAEWASDGSLKAVIDRVYNLDDINEAFEKLEQGHTTGKIVIRMEEGSAPIH